MKAKVMLIILITIFILGCEKEHSERKDIIIRTHDQASLLSMQEAMNFLGSISADSSKALNKIQLNWDRADNQETSTGNKWVINLEGQPSYQNVKQGYRQLVLLRDPGTKKIQARILEIVPDAIYLQKNKISGRETFTGRIFEYDLNYGLKGGKVFSDGKVVGEIKKITVQGQLEHANAVLDRFIPFQGVQGKVMKMMPVESCEWVKDWYVDSEGTVNIHSQRICSTTYFDDGTPSGYYDNVGDSGGMASGGGSTGTSTAPAPSNLPGEDNNIVDPRAMMECFSQIPSANAAFVIRVYVVEPMPGTSFNVGPNSFGHVAISLSKTSGSTTITQTIGFYPTGTGLDKLTSKSQILDNGFVQYNISSTYYVSGESFQAAIDYISNPPKNYHFTDYNCTAFVYGAGQAGGIPIPDPTTQIGLSGPGGAGYAKTPAGMASALRAQKISNPNSDINEAGGTIPPSNGPCNIQ